MPKKEYPHPYLTADVILYSYNKNSILLIERKNDPYKGFWAFPGGFVNEGETGKQAAIRELEEETKADFKELKQFKFVSTPGRDPRGWTVSDVYLGIDYKDNLEIQAADDAKKAHWFEIEVNNEGCLSRVYNCALDTDVLEKLAFDHREILEDAAKYLFDHKLLNEKQ